MSNRSQLSPPTAAPPSSSPTVRSEADLEHLGFFGHGPGTSEEKLREFRDHFKAFGPRTDEAVFPKAVFNAFASRKDLTRPELRNFFTSQRTDAINLDNAFHGQSLQEYLKSMGVKHVTIMGGNADVCATETAMGAATNGFKATILSDRVVSRDDPAGQKPPAQYESELHKLHGQITDRPQELAGNPTKSSVCRR